MQDMNSDFLDVGDNMFIDAQGDIFNKQTFDPIEGQWAWTADGLIPLGAGAGNDATAITTPFLGINEQYRGGAPIIADTWQEAVSKSLEGFMRTNYGVDPIFNWQPGVSGLEQGSQFQIGTLQELANSGFIPGMFFDTSGQVVRNRNTGEWVDPNVSHTQALGGAPFDVLSGLTPDTKLLGFEDIPLGQIEQLVGQMPGELFVVNAERRDLQQQIDQLEDEKKRLQGTEGFDSTDIDNQIRSLWARRDAINPMISLAEARQRGDLQDYNDYLFKLAIDQYTPEAQMVKADPTDVLQRYFDTPMHRLLYGNEADVNNGALGPTERFRADPGYDFAVNEGIRRLQQQSAAKGLLESGATQRDITDFARNMQDQTYQRFLGQEAAGFTDWQNRLQGIASQGAGLSAQSQQAANQVGQSLLGGNLQQGSNLASLFANQGVYGGNAFLNTGAAQANTLMQAASIQAQVEAANAAAKAASGGSGLGGIGSVLSGLGSLIGAF